MKVDFIDIFGTHFENEFPEDATISNACNFLASKLQISDQQIFIISQEEGKSYYRDNEKIQNILNENPDFLVFTICFDIDKNKQYQPQENQAENVIGHDATIRKNKIILPPKDLLNTLLMLKKPKMMNPLYLEYSNIMTHVPNDLQFRVKHIAQLGYQIEDCLSALRTHRYNVQQAIHSLMTLNGPPNSQNQNNSQGHQNAKATRQQSTPIFH